MGITQFIVDRKVFAYFFAVLLAVGGVLSFRTLGQLEDPDFTVKTGIVVTRYPGASPEQVELEVTNLLEQAIQELPAVRYLISWSRPGVSVIRVEIKEKYWGDRLPQVWDELRNKIGDAERFLPPGAQEPDISDDFSFVYGFVLALTGDGFSYNELEEYADGIKKELSIVPGVARVDLWGVQDKVIYLDVSQTQIANFGLTNEDVALTAAIQNKVVDAGYVDIGDRRIRVAPTGEFTSPEEIGSLAVRTSLLDTLTNVMDQTDATAPGTSELIRIEDVATVREGYLDPPRWQMRYNGQPALAIYAASLSGGNVVDTGRNLDRRIEEVLEQLPVGIELHKIAWQSDLVTTAIDSFMVSLAQAVAIVIVVLIIPSGVRMGLIIGSMLIFIILGTFICMAIVEIDLQRMSLGALIIALGMMVDNSCFVSDAMEVRMQKGMSRVQAAIESASSQAWPLLGATVIAIMTFYTIFASTASAGEYCATLFTVVACALMFSWLISMSLTPVMCIDLLPEPKKGGADPYQTGFFRAVRRVVTWTIRHRYLTLSILVSVLAVTLAFSGLVRQMFFPDATRNQLMLDYWAPEGTRIQDVSEGVKAIEKKLLENPRVESVSAFVGSGPPRFYLPVDPEGFNPAYAQLIVNTNSPEDVDPLVQEIEPWLKETIPVLTRLRKYGVGPSDTWKLEARISGPATADLAVLRELGEEAKAILRKSPLAREVRTEMRQSVSKIVPRYSQERGRWAVVSRQDLADTTKRAYDGVTVGLYREGDDLYPVIFRQIEEERAIVAGGFDALQIRPTLATHTVPMGQVVEGIDLEWEDPVIHRWQRRRAETVQCSPIDGETFPALRASVVDEFNALDLPPGYEIFWDGEFDSTQTAQTSLIPGLVPAGVLIMLIIMLLYNSIRTLLCILLVIPFAAIGILWGLVLLDSPLGFVAILGILSLMGMMIKNMIVMTNAIQTEIKEGLDPFQACVEAAVTQARPIMLAAGTTVLGVAPLLPDLFWNAMAVSIMAGLGVGSLFTIILFPTLYATLHGIRE